MIQSPTVQHKWSVETHCTFCHSENIFIKEDLVKISSGDNIQIKAKCPICLELRDISHLVSDNIKSSI